MICEPCDYDWSIVSLRMENAMITPCIFLTLRAGHWRLSSLLFLALGLFTRS